MKLPDHYIFRTLSADDQASFDAFYKLYLASMPPGERKPKPQIAKMVQTPEYRILLLKNLNTVVGYSVCFSPTGEPFVLLEYMGIDADFRNSGLGQALFLKTIQDISSSGSQDYVLLEVDSDSEPSADLEIRQKRKRFYRRLGCLQVGNLAYQLPLQGAGVPPSMDIMIYPINQLNVIRKNQLRCWLTVIYVKVYQMAQGDPRIDQMMGPVDDPIELK